MEGEGPIRHDRSVARRPVASLRTPHSALRTGLILALAAACGRSDGPRVTVTIPAGATLDAAIDSLAASRVLEHPGPFRLYAKLRGEGVDSGVEGDRKSTRLNSSHVRISYAV